MDHGTRMKHTEIETSSSPKIRTYRTPTLTVYGHVRQLTASGTGVMDEGPTLQTDRMP
jgi:hypothetical protein